MKKSLCLLLVLLLALSLLPARGQEDLWRFGFGVCDFPPDPDSPQPLYIAGYHNGETVQGIHDVCQARATWLDAGGDGVLLIGVDCVGLDRSTVNRIRDAVGPIPGCARVHIYATHTHAGADTLGLWGPIGRDGKNDLYMDAMVSACAQAAQDALSSRRSGRLCYGAVLTRGMYRDSRFPYVTDETLYQLRFEPENGENGLRLLFFGAHAESLRGGNRLLSRDYPGALCDLVLSETGDDAQFFPGAIGGLVMTREFVPASGARAVENMEVTARKLADYVHAITPDAERILHPRLAHATVPFDVPLDNAVFALYKVLGILGHHASTAQSATGLAVSTELSALLLDDVALALLPGELFPELVTGEAYGSANPEGVNPRPLLDIATEYGASALLIVGLCDDELGYIVPPSDYLVHPTVPYFERVTDQRGEDHYEETNSVGPDCATRLAEAFEQAMEGLR